MNRERWISALEGAALAMCLALGGCGCLASGFWMDVPLTQTAVACGAAAVVFSLCFAFRKRLLLVCLLVLAGGFLWQSGRFVNGIGALLWQMTQFYDRAYGWGVVSWSGGRFTAGDLETGLCITGGFVALVTAWNLCGRHRAWLAGLTAFLPLVACLLVTDTVPEEKWLFLLLLGLILLCMTGLSRRKADGQSARLTALLALPVSLALLLLFLAVPREGYTARHSPEEIGQLFSDWIQGRLDKNLITSLFAESGDEENLAAAGPRTGAERPVMEVRATKSGVLYLRGRAYGEYDGKKWRAAQGKWSENDFPGLMNMYASVQISTRQPHDIIYFPYNPGRVSVPGEKSQAGIKNEDRATDYTIVWVDPWNPSAGMVPALAPELEKIYLQLPDATKEAAQEILSNVIPDYDPTAAAGQPVRSRIIEYVRNSAVYDLNTPRMPIDVEDFAIWFLEEADTGYCIHFATAATVLLRAAGIPARYVTGYLVNCPAGEMVTVREKDAHAWVEYYQPGSGWLKLEPTPAAGLPGESEQEVTDTPPEQTDTAETTRATIGTEPTEESPNMPEQSGNGADLSGLRAVFQALFWISAAAAGIIFQWQLRLRARRKRQQMGTPNEQALARWQEAVLLSRLLRREPDGAILELAQKAKYSQHTLTQEELAVFDGFLARAQEQLRQKPLPMRFVYRIIFACW